MVVSKHAYRIKSDTMIKIFCLLNMLMMTCNIIIERKFGLAHYTSIQRH